MPGPKRRPVAHAAVTAISDQAIFIWRRMRRLRCVCEPPIAGSTKTPTNDPCPPCERWYDLLAEFAKLIPHKPWDHPLLAPPTMDPEFDHKRSLYTGKMGSAREPTLRQQELENALRRADRELRRSAREARKDAEIVREPKADGVAPGATPPASPAR